MLRGQDGHHGDRIAPCGVCVLGRALPKPVLLCITFFLLRLLNSLVLEKAKCGRGETTPLVEVRFGDPGLAEDINDQL